MAISEKTRMVLNNCKYYDEIVDYPFVEGDILTSYIIDEYSRHIFDVDSQDARKTNYLKLFDISVYRYLKNNKFKQRLKDKLTFLGINYNLKEDIIECEIFDILIEEYKIFRSRIISEKEDTRWL